MNIRRANEKEDVYKRQVFSRGILWFCGAYSSFSAAGCKQQCDAECDNLSLIHIFSGDIFYVRAISGPAFCFCADGY